VKLSRAKFNSGSFFVGSFGAAALGSAIERHFHRQLDIRLELAISLVVGLLLAFEAPARGKHKPEPPVGPPPKAR
jgi:hypothetical protein